MQKLIKNYCKIQLIFYVGQKIFYYHSIIFFGILWFPSSNSSNHIQKKYNNNKNLTLTWVKENDTQWMKISIAEKSVKFLNKHKLKF